MATRNGNSIYNFGTSGGSGGGGTPLTITYNSSSKTLDKTPSEVLAAVNANQTILFDGEGMKIPMKWQITQEQFLVLWCDVNYPNVDYNKIIIQAYIPDNTWTQSDEQSPLKHEGDFAIISTTITVSGTSARSTKTQGELFAEIEEYFGKKKILFYLNDGGSDAVLCTPIINQVLSPYDITILCPYGYQKYALYFRVSYQSTQLPQISVIQLAR